MRINIRDQKFYNIGYNLELVQYRENTQIKTGSKQLA